MVGGLGVDFLRGAGLVGSDFQGMKGWSAVFFLEKHHYPFDLQVGPLLGTQGGSWPLLEKS